MNCAADGAADDLCAGSADSDESNKREQGYVSKE
jgi:hypothetical protein